MPSKTEATYDVYVQRNPKSKPLKVGTVKGQWPKTWTHEGTVYYFATADVTEKWVSFTAVPPDFGVGK